MSQETDLTTINDDGNDIDDMVIVVDRSHTADATAPLMFELIWDDPMIKTFTDAAGN